MGGNIKRFKMIDCFHILPSGDTAWVDMTHDRKFMQKFAKPLSATVKNEMPEFANPSAISPQKARKLIQGAHLFVCQRCGCHYIGEKGMKDSFSRR